MKQLDSVFKYAGVAAIPVYIAFTLISHLYLPQANPLENWLSDYGNKILNPGGAAFYNAGCVLTALLLALFYIGMYRWYSRERTSRKFNICYVFAQICGFLSSVFLIFTAIFTLGTDTALHSIFAQAHMMAMDFFINFTAIGFLLNPKINKAVGIFGFFISIFNIVTTNAFTDFFIAEWIYFLSFMIYVVLITLIYEQLVQKKM